MSYPALVSTDVQHRLAAEVEQAAPSRRRLLQRDPEYRALRKLADRNRKAPPRTPTAALQHVTDVAREMTHATYAALAVTGAEDYVEGFVVAGFDDAALKALKVPPQGHGPLGSMRQDGLAVRLDDVAQHAKAFGFPPKHPQMKALLGLPIFARGEVRGALYVTDRRDRRPFTDGDEAALRVLSHHAGLIIETSWY
jgi:GAF domain-containing protein